MTPVAPSVPATQPTEPAAPDREEELATADGGKLHVAHFEPRGAGGAFRYNVVALHGFTVYAGPYGNLFRRLSEAGHAVTAFDLRGHGRSSGRRGHIDRFDRYHDDLASVVAAARQAHPALPLVLLAHSFGCTIALDAVLGGRVQPERLILAAPFLGRFMKVAGWKLALSGLASRLLPTFAPDNEIKPEDGSRNPVVIDRFFKDPLIHHVASARWFTETVAAQERILQNAARLSVPTLLLAAGNDRVVSQPPIEALLAAAPAFIQAKHYQPLFHELFLEPEWADVAADVTRWLGSAPSSLRAEAAPNDVPAILPSPP